jgi:hypothetical protein
MEFVELSLLAVAGTIFTAAAAAWVYTTLPKSLLIQIELHGRYGGLGQHRHLPPGGSPAVSAFDGLQRQLA